MNPDLWSPQGFVPVLIRTYTRPQIPPSTTEWTMCAPCFLNSSSVPSLTAATPGARSSAYTVGSHATKQPPAVSLTRVLACFYSAALCDQYIFSFCLVWQCQQIASRSNSWKLVISLCVPSPPTALTIQYIECWGDRNTHLWCGCSSATEAHELQFGIETICWHHCIQGILTV